MLGLCCVPLIPVKTVANDQFRGNVASEGSVFFFRVQVTAHVKEHCFRSQIPMFIKGIDTNSQMYWICQKNPSHRTKKRKIDNEAVKPCKGVFSFALEQSYLYVVEEEKPTTDPNDDSPNNNDSNNDNQDQRKKASKEPKLTLCISKITLSKYHRCSCHPILIPDPNNPDEQLSSFIAPTVSLLRLLVGAYTLQKHGFVFGEKRIGCPKTKLYANDGTHVTLKCTCDEDDQHCKAMITAKKKTVKGHGKAFVIEDYKPCESNKRICQWCRADIVGGHVDTRCDFFEIKWVKEEIKDEKDDDKSTVDGDDTMLLDYGDQQPPDPPATSTEAAMTDNSTEGMDTIQNDEKKKKYKWVKKHIRCAGFRYCCDCFNEVKEVSLNRTVFHVTDLHVTDLHVTDLHVTDLHVTDFLSIYF